MKIVLTELYIILIYEKFYFFYLFDYPWIKKYFCMIVILRFVLFTKENVEI